MAKRTIDGKRAIVTGASSGIGWHLARQLAQLGAQVIAIARRQERLEQLAQTAAELPGTIIPLPGDITQESVRNSAIQTCQKTLGGLDLLINNAGIGALGLFENASRERLYRVMDVNFFALVELTRLAIPLLKQGRQPAIVNVGSILGYRAAPHCAEYCASKAAVRAFSESLRIELAGQISVIHVAPGTTETEFFENVLEHNSAPSWPVRAVLSPEAVAQRILRAIQKDKKEVIPFLWGKFYVRLNAVWPSLAERMMRRVL